MKSKLLLLACCLTVAASEMAPEQAAIESLRTSGTLTNVVKALIASGDVCQQTGHQWRDGRPGERNGLVFADYHPGTSFRTCVLCQTCQTKTESWK